MAHRLDHRRQSRPGKPVYGAFCTALFCNFRFMSFQTKKGWNLRNCRMKAVEDNNQFQSKQNPTKQRILKEMSKLHASKVFLGLLVSSPYSWQSLKNTEHQGHLITFEQFKYEQFNSMSPPRHQWPLVHHHVIELRTRHYGHFQIRFSHLGVLVEGASITRIMALCCRFFNLQRRYRWVLWIYYCCH